MKLKQKAVRFFFLAILAASVFIVFNISLKLADARSQSPQPQAILTLGGGVEREKFTAQFARSHSSLPIWVSSGLPRKQARQIFDDAGVPRQQVNLDYRAADTVSNFTSLVKEFQHKNYQHIYLITSDFHMPRSKAIAILVLGSQGITYTPISLTTNRPPEPKVKTIRDITRSLLWIFTRRTGASLNQ